MSLGAMMANGRAFANRHDLIAGSLVVPAGVTAVTVFAQARAGTAGPNTVSGGTAGGGGGGAGGAILGCVLTVTPGDTLTAGVAGDFVTWELRRNGSLFARVVRGGAASVFSDPRGAAGGAAIWDVTSTSASGGAQQNTAGATGNAGGQAATAGGLLVGGGGGGAGNTISPPLSGGAGGASGNGLAGNAAVSYWGGGGGGAYENGGTRLTATTETAQSVEFITLFW